MLYDRAEIKGSARITKDGYFVAEALVARANNIQTYRARELQLTDREPQAVVRVFRPEAEVFHRDALASLAHRPVTLDHPADPVDSGNWKALAIGDVGDEVLRDGEFVRVPIKIMDAKAIERIKSDHREFSLGYSLTLDMTPGEHDGQAYDAVARELRYNHLAAVPAARGGTELRIVDERTYDLADDGGNNPGERRETSKPTTEPSGSTDGGSHVATKTITFDGLPLEVTDAAEAAITKLLGQVKDAVSAKEAAEAALDTAKTESAAKDAEIVKLKQAVEDAKVTPDQLRAAAKDYAEVCDKAKALKVEFAEDADIDAIRKAVVDAKMGDTAKGYDAKEIAAAFAVLTKDAATDDQPDKLRDAIRDSAPPSDETAKAYDEMVKDLVNARDRKKAA